MHTPVEQAALLNLLFSYFSLESYGKGNPWPLANTGEPWAKLTFIPGAFEPGILLEIVLHQKYSTGWYCCRFELDAFNRRASWIGPTNVNYFTPHLEDIEISYKEEVLGKIIIPIQPNIVVHAGQAQAFRAGPSSSWQHANSCTESWAFVRLRLSNGATTRTTPANGHWLGFDLRREESAAALDQSLWVTDSNALTPPKS